MARTSSVYYIAPSAISIVPNCNGTASDLAVTISRGTKIKVYYPDIADLDTSSTTKAYLEWTMQGRNRRLAEPEKPYTIYARLKKSDTEDGYLVFAAQTLNPDTGEYEDPYVLSPNLSSTNSYSTTDRSGTRHTWSPIPSRQTENGRTDYWWVKMGTVSAPDENNQRTVDLDTGILGTEEYNNQWRLNPDDLPDNPVRIVITDRGSWAATPHVIYHGPTGIRTPDGTLDAAVASALGWEGTEPLTFTNGEPIAEPYHHESLTRHRFIAKRLGSENSTLTDAELYEKLTTASKGWEEENELEISRVWKNGKLWECAADGTAEEPHWGTTKWTVVSGNTVFVGQIQTSNGGKFRNGNVDTILTMLVWWGDEEVTLDIMSDPGYQIEWKRYTGYNTATREFEQQPEDLVWTPAVSSPNSIVLTRSDMGSGWMTDYRRALIKCIVRADGIDSVESNFYL